MKELSVSKLRKEFGGGERLKHYVHQRSSMRLIWYPLVPRSVFDLPKLEQVRIIVGGICSKFPSVSNSRLVKGYFDRNAGKARALTTPSPDYQVILEVLSRLYAERVDPAMPEPSFLDDAQQRLFVSIQLGDACARIDSHNAIKAVCDWLQGIKLIRNDRNCDALAIHKREHAHPGAGFEFSEILISRAGLVSNRLRSLACR